MNSPRKIIIHCTDTKNFKFVNPKAVERWHQMKGWKKIGYHRLINVDGSVYIGRYFEEDGAHTVGENTRSIGIALVGRDRYTKAQFDSLKNLISEVKALYHLNFNDIYCHNEFNKDKTCPGMRAADLCIWYLRSDPRVIEKYMEVTE